jgi:hypothetical protein
MMGMTQAQMERKLRQLDNDVQSIYEMLTGIAGTQMRQGNRLEELATGQERLAAQQERLAAQMESGFAALNAKLDRLLGGREEQRG